MGVTGGIPAVSGRVAGVAGLPPLDRSMESTTVGDITSSPTIADDELPPEVAWRMSDIPSDANMDVDIDCDCGVTHGG